MLFLAIFGLLLLTGPLSFAAYQYFYVDRASETSSLELAGIAAFLNYVGFILTYGIEHTFTVLNVSDYRSGLFVIYLLPGIGFVYLICPVQVARLRTFRGFTEAETAKVFRIIGASLLFILTARHAIWHI